MSAFETVTQNFIEKREAAARTADAKAEIVRRAVPELVPIDAELSGTAARIMTELRKGKDGLDERLAAVRERNTALQAERARILLAHGYAPDCTDIVYECTKCNDSGFVGTTMCECFRKALLAERYYDSGLGQSLADKSFDTLNPNLACGKPVGGVSVRDNLAENIATCKKFASNAALKPQYLLLMGGTGLGKTHLTAATCRGAIDAGCSVVYDSIQSIIRAFWNDADSASAKYLGCTLLAIDDFGTEFRTSHSDSVIYDIINTRMLEGKSILINTNLTSQDFPKHYDNRVISRIFSSFTILKFFGEDVRKLIATGYAK